MSAEQAANAWLVGSEQARLANGQLALADAGESTDKPTRGDWVVVVEEARSTVGRVLRARQRSAELDLYFDRLVRLPVAADPALTAAATASFQRITWPAFETHLRAGGLSSVDHVPVFGAGAHLRDLLQVAVEDDLLGPAEGPFEYVKETSVRDRYLVGKLAPRRPTGDEVRVEPSSAVDEPGEPEEEEVARRHQPGEEFEGTSGRVDADDDALDEIDTTDNQSLVPSSVGMTFCVAPDVQAVRVEAVWGRYERVPNDEHDFTKTRKNRTTGEEEQVKVRVWQRVPCGGALILPLEDGPIGSLAPDADQSDVRLQGVVRTNQAGERLVTLFLVNGQLEPNENQDSAWVFQPELSVTAAADSSPAVFLRTPRAEVPVEDEERDRLALIYREEVEFAVGHGVSVHADVADGASERAVRVSTRVLPTYEVPVTETPGLEPEDRPAMRRMVERGWLDMSELAALPRDELNEVFRCLLDDYSAWIAEQEERIGREITGFDPPAEEVIARCREVALRLEEGAALLTKDETALEAFRFANRVMALQRTRGLYAQARRRQQKCVPEEFDKRENRSWRAFQLAFLLLSIPSLADPRHPDRTEPVEAFADLLWFPTGGGKTEAYLGVAAFAMAMRRLRADLGGLDGRRGLCVIMRYTLRLLTLQQFQRATALLCAMESIRKEDVGRWGEEPFTLGLWVGNRVTPGTTEDAAAAIRAIRDKDRSKSGIASPAQLTSCPWCGSEIAPGRDIVVDTTAKRTSIYCGDKLGRCDFSRTRSGKAAHPGLPVRVVDDEIYHRPPSMMIATVDKFAMMAWRAQARTLFGRISEECERHGLLWPGHECGTGHHRKGTEYPAAKVVCAERVRPPDLVIQDEFHLISGPLGTMVGLYETAIDDLGCWTLGDKTVRPKVVASTATIRGASRQVKNVFMRRVCVFPPSGLDADDNFFSVQRSVEERPGRRYLGICAPGASRPSVLIRTYTAFLTAAQFLFEHFGDSADAYMTLVGYFNSLRELGGMRRLCEDDVQFRAFRVAMSAVARPGLAQRAVFDPAELTSRVSNQEIPKYLDQLEKPFRAVWDKAAGRFVRKEGEPADRPIDIVLATNMLSVGVDVSRLGLMVVNGQPKSTAEYIQATSRVGRAKNAPGLVATVLTWARPRDLSHYETFEHYHATFYQHVEAQSVTPFSPRALDRGLTGMFVSHLRHEDEDFCPNGGAEAMTTTTLPSVVDVTDAIAQRTWEVTEDAGRKSLAEAALKSRIDDWARKVAVGGRELRYEKRGEGSSTAVPLLEKPGINPWTSWTVPMSMREVEPGVRVVMESDRSTDEPVWRARPPSKDDDE